MRDLLLLAIHLVVTLAKFLGPGGVRRVAAESLLLKQQLLISNRSRHKIHKALVHRKYRLLFSSSCRRRKPGPKGPSAQLIAAIVEMKQHNPKFGRVRIAQQITHAFGTEIDKDVVRRVLAKHFGPEPGADGPSWLTLIAHAKDSVWSVDLFRAEPSFGAAIG